MTPRALGSLTTNDLGKAITTEHQAGTITSIRHYRIKDQGTYTSVLIQVPAQPGKPDHREIRDPSTTEIQISGTTHP